MDLRAQGMNITIPTSQMRKLKCIKAGDRKLEMNTY